MFTSRDLLRIQNAKDQIKNQLARVGLIKDEDLINQNSENWHLVTAALVAGCPTNLARVSEGDTLLTRSLIPVIILILFFEVFN